MKFSNNFQLAVEFFRMSCENVPREFKIEIKFTEVRVKTAATDSHGKDTSDECLSLEMTFLGNKIEPEDEPNSFPFVNGCYDLDLSFILKNDLCEVSDEDFVFDSLGSLVMLNVHKLPKKSLESRKSMKKLKDGKPKLNQLASGSINLLLDLKKFQNIDMKVFHVNFQPFNEFEICVQYVIQFWDYPDTDTTLFAYINQFYNLPLEPNEQIEVAFHFPTDDKIFKTVFMHQDESLTDTAGYILDEYLKKAPLEFEASGISFSYENIQSQFGFEFLADLITCNGRLLVEIRWRKQVFMTFINLEVFNYEGVEEASFVVPMFHFHKRAVLEHFKQELSAFPFPEKAAKGKGSSKKGEELAIELIPLIVDEKHVMMKVSFKIAQPLTPESSIDELKIALNQHVPFMEELSLKDTVISESENDFEKNIEKISIEIEKLIDDNPEIDIYDFERKIKKLIECGELPRKTELKQAVKELIGNKYNMERKTETNQEFKVKEFQIVVLNSYEICFRSL